MRRALSLTDRHVSSACARQEGATAMTDESRTRSEAIERAAQCQERAAEYDALAHETKQRGNIEARRIEEGISADKRISIDVCKFHLITPCPRRAAPIAENNSSSSN